MRRSDLERSVNTASAGGAVTLEMVASEAGVSPSTVSRILNGTARVRESKVRAVEAAISKLRFTPNPVARSLARGKSMTVGIVTQAFGSPFYGEALTAIDATKCRRISRAGAHWLVANPWAARLTLRGDAVCLAPWRWPRHLIAALPLDIG